MQFKDKFEYVCCDCGAGYQNEHIIYLCPVCSLQNNKNGPPKGVLKTTYDYTTLKRDYPEFINLKESGFLPLLPIDDLKSLPNLRIGKTPLYHIDELDGMKLPFRLMIKDDSQNPSFSFKDRASGLVSAFARENGIDTIVAASTGNAGSSLACICAAQQQKAIVLVPESAPAAKLIQIMMYGAQIIPVRGTYDDCFELSIRATEKFGWYNRNTAYNPLTIEGKKTVSFEIYDQLKECIPDRIFVPVGDGVIISAVYKGFEDLLKLDIIDRLPILVAVQSKGSDNLVRNLAQKDFSIRESHTIADSIAVDVPRNFLMTRQYIQHYQGEYLRVQDEDILSASQILAENTGIFAEPAAAAAFAGFLHYLKQNLLPDDSKNLVLTTGSGLKDIKAVEKKIQIPNSIDANLESLLKFIEY